MLHHPRTIALSVVLLLAFLVPRTLAQELPLDEETLRKLRQSHAPLGLEVGDPEQMQKILQQRLRRAQDLAGLQKLIQDAIKNPEKYGIGPEQRRLLEEAARKGLGDVRPDMIDPRLRDLVEEVIEKQGRNPDLKFKPEQIEEWKKLLPKPDASPMPNVDPKPPEPTRPRTPPDQQPNPNPPDVAHPPQPPAVPPAPQFEPPPAEKTPFQKWIERRSTDMARWMRNRDWGQNDPAIQKAIRDFSRSLMPRESSNWPQLTEGAKSIRDRLPALDNVLPRTNARNWLPDLSKWTPRDPGFTTPNVGRPALPSASAWEGVLWLAMAVCVGLIAWRLLAWRQAVAEQKEQWRPGPWPVRPEAVRTRDDLVKAFEHLALLLLGRQALPLNHLVIGTWLASDPRQADPARQRAVWNLAGLYEQARYAPPQQLLPPTDLESARHDLTLLAGGAA